VWSNGGTILKSENLIIEGKIFYNVTDKWNNDWSKGGMNGRVEN